MEEYLSDIVSQPSSRSSSDSIMPRMVESPTNINYFNRNQGHQLDARAHRHTSLIYNGEASTCCSPFDEGDTVATWLGCRQDSGIQTAATAPGSNNKIVLDGKMYTGPSRRLNSNADKLNFTWNLDHIELERRRSGDVIQGNLYSFFFRF